MAIIHVRSLNRSTIRYDVDGLHYFDRQDRRIGAVEWAREYDTLGDGDTQHTPAGPIADSNLADFCLSLQAHLLECPNDIPTILKCFRFSWIYRPEVLFLATIKYREDKTQYFHRGERKISTSASKQYDKRWEEVQEWMNGSLEAVYSLESNARAVDTLSKVIAYQDILDILDTWNSSDEFFSLPKDSTRRIMTFHDFLEGHQEIRRATDDLKTYLRQQTEEQDGSERDDHGCDDEDNEEEECDA